MVKLQKIPSPWIPLRFVNGCLLSIICSCPLPLLAQSPPPRSETVKKELEARKEELHSQRERATTLEQDLATLDAERAKINSRLVETAQLIQKSEDRLTTFEIRMKELETQEKKVKETLQTRQRDISKLLGALQRMGRNPPPVIVTEREDALKMVRSAMLLSNLFPGMKKEAQELTDTLNKLTLVLDEIKTEASKVKEETIRLAELRSRLTSLAQTKRQTITEQQTELKKVAQAAAEMSKGVTDLSELIKRLDVAVAENTELNVFEAKSKALFNNNTNPDLAKGQSSSEKIPASSEPPLPAPPLSDPSTKPGGAPTSLSKGKDTKVVELSPGPASEPPNSAGRLQPALPFQLTRAKLPFPASGKKVLNFGEKTKYGSNSKGIVFETRFGAQVTSPCDGWIVYAGEFRSYGKLLIINAGGGYHILMAGLSQIDVQPGQFVLTAEPVGTMSTSKKETSDTSTSNPVLYIEFRKDGQPINPDPWWFVTNQKAEG